MNDHHHILYAYLNQVFDFLIKVQRFEYFLLNNNDLMVFVYIYLLHLYLHHDQVIVE
jgi:hypothetical protein